MKVIASHYKGDWAWIPAYSDDFFIYNRSDDPIPNSIQVPNIGNADYDRLTYLIDNYDNLPEVFILTKSNLFKYITKKEFNLVKNNTTFTPLLTRNHKTHMPVCFYDTEGMYWEVANSGFLNEVPAKYVGSWQEWCAIFGLPQTEYIPFAPGGNYILTKNRVLRHPKALYEEMRGMLDWAQLPGEAQCVERSYFYLWR